MYGYRQSNDNALMTNLNSISSSLSSIDTVGRRTNAKASADNLLAPRSHSMASTSLLWKNSKEDRYSTTASVRNGTRHTGSDIYYVGKRKFLSNYCLNSETALNFILLPLLLLTILRQVFDFLGQIWLQILINFFTIILIIVALFGIRQHRVSYITLFSAWALFNTIWNVMVFCVYTKIRDVGLGEDALSLHTGATSWWRTNGPGCLSYNITSIQHSMTILQPNIITGCRIDYHHVESAQATIHSVFSFIALLICCCVVSNIRGNPAFKSKKSNNSDKPYRLDTFVHARSKVNQDPYPNHMGSRFGQNSASLRRAVNRTGSRSSQHSSSSARCVRRRNRSTDGTLPTPRGSTSSMQRSQKYGSISSRRSSKLKERRGDITSLTYGTTGGERAGPSNRNRLSSLSSVDYLPSYQPPHSSSANLLSSYGEVSSIDSYNNNVSGHRSSRSRQVSVKSIGKGNTNPTYTGSRSSVCSNNANINNYDDLSYIYGNSSNKNSESLYAPSSSNGPDSQRQEIYQRSKSGSIGRRSGSRLREKQAFVPYKIHAETYQNDNVDSYQNGDTFTKTKFGSTNGGFNSFTNPYQQNPETRNQLNGDKRLVGVNNNYITTNYNNTHEENGQPNSDYQSNGLKTFENGSRASNNSMTQQQQIYTNQQNSRHPIYSNHIPNCNSETPI